MRELYNGIIYKITNLLNGKLYIGKTTENPATYWNMHKNRADNGVNKILYAAMRKYGHENFSFEIVEEIRSNAKEELNKTLNVLEIHHIKKFNAKIPNGYNVTDGGEGLYGMTFSDEHRNKIRLARLGVARPESVRQKLRKPKTEEHKQKLRGPKTEEHKAKLRKPKSEEVKQKLREVMLGRYDGKDNPFYGRKHSEETKKWIKAVNTEYQNRPEIKLQNKLSQPHRKEVAMLDKDSLEEIHRFISLREAKQWLAENTKYKGDTKTIKLACHSGGVSYGFRWNFIE